MSDHSWLKVPGSMNAEEEEEEDDEEEDDDEEDGDAMSIFF